MTEYLSESALDRIELLARVAADPGEMTCQLKGNELLALVEEVRERRRIDREQATINEEMAEKSRALIREQCAARGEKWEGDL